MPSTGNVMRRPAAGRAVVAVGSGMTSRVSGAAGRTLLRSVAECSMAPLAMGVLRVISIVVIALASTAGVGALVWRAAVPSEVAARTDVEILVLGEHVARGVAAASTDGDAARRAAGLAELAASLQIDLSVHGPSGAPTAAAGAPIPPLAPPELAAVLAGQVLRVGEPWPPRVAAPLVRDGQRVGFVVVQLGNATSPSRGLNLALAAALAVVAAALCAGVASGGRGSLGRLEAALEELETLPRGEPLDLGSSRELRGVAERFNRLLERAAAAADRDEELLAIVARELRRPVHDARETLKRMAAGEPFARGPVALDEELDLLETILEDVLTTARLKLDRVVLRKRRTRLGVLVQDAAAQVASSNPVSFDIAPDLPEVDVDGRLLSRTVAEIVKNAAQHSDPGAAIAVRAHASGPDVVVTVTDGGGGIGPEDLGRLFEPFFRSRATRRHLPGRTGLGLTLAKRVVEAHGGTIGVESEPGVGTTITFKLPAATGEAPPDRPSLDGGRESRLSIRGTVA